MNRRRFFAVMLVILTTLALIGGMVGGLGIALGATWSPIASGTTDDIVDIWGISSSDAFAVTAGGALMHYDGRSWSPFDPGPFASLSEYDYHVHAIWGTSASNLWVVGFSYHPEGGWGSSIFRYDGISWMISKTGEGDTFFQDIWGSSAYDVFVVRAEGPILHFDGSQWSDINVGSAVGLRSIWGRSATDVFGVGVNGTIVHYDGSVWSEMPSNCISTLDGIWCSSTSDIYAVGRLNDEPVGHILHYTGGVWGDAYLGTGNDSLNGIWGSSASNVFAVGLGGTILHYNGISWNPMTSGTTKNLKAIWGSTTAGFFAVGEGGTILHLSPYPDRPVNNSPADGATGNSLTPTLVASPFAGAEGDTHAASRWQIRSGSGDYNSSVWDSGSASPSTSIGVPTGELDYSTTYFWRVGYRDSGNLWSSYSKETSFTTAAATNNAPTVSTVAATGIGSTSATLNLSLTGLGSASSVQVFFEWGLGTDYGNTTTPQTMNTTGNFSCTLSDLSVAATYHFRALTAGDGTAYGSDLSFATGAVPAAPPVVTTNPATNTGMAEATVNGDLTGLGSATSVQVCFDWGPTAAYGSTTAPKTMNGAGTFSFELSGLAADTTYHFRGRAVGDDTAYGTDLTFTTRSTPTTPPTVTTGDADAITGDSARINGDLTSLGTAANVTLSVLWGTTSGGPYTNETGGADQAAPGTFHFELGGLAPGTTFYYQARAVGDGTGCGMQKSFTTTGRVPAIVGVVADNGRPGDDFTITISGTGLMGATAVGFGDGLTVSEFRVVSNTEITAKVSIDEAAEPGKRDVTVTTPRGEVIAPGGFTVNDSGYRLHLWVYVVAVAAGLVVLGVLATLGVWLKRRLAR